MLNLSSSNFFIIAYALLLEPKKCWRVHDFENTEVNITGNIASKIFRELIDREILERKGGRTGPNSHSRLISGKKLLKLCIDSFKHQDCLQWKFQSTEAFEKVCKRLQERGYDFILAKITGVHERFEHINDSKYHLHVLEKEFFNINQRNKLTWEAGLQYVTNGGNVFITLPRYKKFLNYKTQKKDALKIPSDFYTYLDLYNSTYPMAEAQISRMEKILKEEGSGFI